MNIEYKKENGCPLFFQRVTRKKIAVIFDTNTKVYAESIIDELSTVCSGIETLEYSDKRLHPTPDKTNAAINTANSCEYLLAVGSGTLNDIAKFAAHHLDIPCGIYVTAPSMDGYASNVSALTTLDGKKITVAAKSPEDILIDPEILMKSPKRLIGAGVGDLLGKYTSLMDWNLSHLITGEFIHSEAFGMMESALNDCINNFEHIIRYDKQGVTALINALIASGLSMKKCGNSRPASGAEHHMSHFIEMQLSSADENAPYHGETVGLGTLVSLEIYQYLLNHNIIFTNCQKVYPLIEKLPTPDKVREKLHRMGCPVNYSTIGIDRDTVADMLKNAHKIRERFTILTLINQMGLTKEILPVIWEKYC